ncbi:MAG TPA: hypothetical protein VN654_15680 [Vicinamibacterales bacterium]|nr:hypothetical protein [Vicinamibacterales bacterium]
MMDVVSQTAGTFAGRVGLTATGSSEPPCSSSFGYTASMRPDGTISDFRVDGGLGVGTCSPVSAPTFSGTVTNTNIKITITDRAMCRDIFGIVREFERVQETDRTLTISLNRSAPVSAS